MEFIICVCTHLILESCNPLELALQVLTVDVLHEQRGFLGIATPAARFSARIGAQVERGDVEGGHGLRT